MHKPSQLKHQPTANGGVRYNGVAQPIVVACMRYIGCEFVFLFASLMSIKAMQAIACIAAVNKRPAIDLYSQSLDTKSHDKSHLHDCLAKISGKLYVH
eukprot:scaffold159498_cov30-Prasinocladus_malaysianus.AAC.2